MYIYIYHCIIFTLSLDLLSWFPSPLHVPPRTKDPALAPALAEPCEPCEPPWTRRSHPAGEQSSNEMDLGDRNKL